MPSLERYTIQTRLGHGSYGQVYRGVDGYTGELVAVKVIKRNIAASAIQGFSAAVLREAAILKSLKHKNIIELKDVVLSQSRAYLITTLYHCDLRKHIHLLRGQGHVTVIARQLKSFTRQILEAISYCHEQRILHRDLKPDNILLDRTRQLITIADFGMARKYQLQQALTGQCVTAWYRCPEIILGENRYGSPVDIWSIGCILAEMINLQPLFECHTEVDSLVTMFRLFGTPNESSWPGVSSLQHFQPLFPKWNALPATRLVQAAAVSNLERGALELLTKMLQLDPAKRISARTALDDVFFAMDTPYDLNELAASSSSTQNASTESGLSRSSEQLISTEAEEIPSRKKPRVEKLQAHPPKQNETVPELRRSKRARPCQRSPTRKASN